MRAFAIIGLVAVSFAFGAGAADRACTKADQSAAEKGVDLVVNPQQLHKAWKDHGHCAEGPVADLFTDAIVRVIVDWKAVEAIARPMDQEREYRAFVYRHLKSAVKEDLDAIHSRAKMSCPKGLEAFCSELVSAVKPMEPLKLVPMAPIGTPPPTEAPKK